MINRAFIIGLLLLQSAVFLQGAEIVNRKNMRLDFGKARPFVRQKPFFEVDFGKNPGVWDMKSRYNYQNLLTLDTTGSLFGEKCFQVYRNNKAGIYTMWQISTKPFPCNVPAGPVVISVTAATSEDLEKIRFNDRPSEIVWCNGKGEILSTSPFVFNNFSREFAVSQTPGMAPAGAKSFIIRLGFTSPRINKGCYFAVKSVALISTAKKVEYVKSYSYETSILSAGNGKISWNASTPAGTSIRIAVSTAPHNRK